MYACKQCGTGNPLDSSFCKKCGTALPENELADARVKLNEMLEEGNNLFTDGRTDEAMLIAEAAVLANPSSHLAQSLKGLCHERMGQVAEALECYETAVGLNPDSSLDKVKVAALRNRLAQRVSDVPVPNRRSAAVMAGASMVVVLVLGCLVAIGMNGRKEPAKIVANTPAPIQPLAQDLTAVTPQNPATTTQTPPTSQQPVTQTSPVQTNEGYRIPQLPFGNGSGLPVPSVVGPGVISTEPEKPLNPPGPALPPAKKADDNSGPAPEQLKTPDGTTAAPPEDQGYVHIEVSGGHKKPTLGGSEEASDGHEVATVLQAAQQLYQLGRYDQAASKYGKVAELGGNSGRLQQRLGDCYRNLGKNDASRSAYNRAITMYQTQIKHGNDVSGNQRGLDTCESALKVLGG